MSAVRIVDTDVGARYRESLADWSQVDQASGPTLPARAANPWFAEFDDAFLDELAADWCAQPNTAGDPALDQVADELLVRLE